MVTLYGEVYGHDRTTASTYINDNVFSAAVERLTLRRVVAFMSANQTSPGLACEMFFLAPIEVVGCVP